MKSGIFQIVDPCPLSPERLRELESALSSAAGVLAHHQRASDCGDRLSFFVHALKVHRTGSGAVVCGREVPAGDMGVIASIKSMEPELLSGFSRMVQKVLLRVSARNGRSAVELQSDAYEAFCRALVS